MIMFGFFHRKQPADSYDEIHSNFPTNNKFASLNICARGF